MGRPKDNDEEPVGNSKPGTVTVPKCKECGKNSLRCKCGSDDLEK